MVAEATPCAGSGDNPAALVATRVHERAPQT
jgi:hypothetical protein